MSETHTVRKLLDSGAQRLERAGLQTARQEVAWLLGRLLDVRAPELYLYEQPIPSDVTVRFWEALQDRADGVPLQYLIGVTEFYGRRFAVAPGVFIPRPETEAVVEVALERLKDLQARRGRPLRLLEFGTGSGCIAVTVACALPTCVLVGVELSWKALCIAQGNAKRHGCAARVRLVQGWWADAISGMFDGMLANPPYIPAAAVDRLPRDVRHEPRLSLDGGPDGMRDLSQLVARAERLLAPGGVLALECGEAQAGELSRHVRGQSWAEAVRGINDLAGRPRGVLAVRSDYGDLKA